MRSKTFRAAALAGALCTLALAQAQTSAADTEAPAVLFVNPQSGTEEVAVNTPITFLFSEEMASAQSIEWSANVNPAGFNYTWLNDGMVLVATYLPGFPGNTTISWKLNPTAGNANFRDLAGNLLPISEFSGTFKTAAGGGGTVDPCEGGGQNSGAGFGSISKQVSYVQTGNAAPVLDLEQPPTFGASFRQATNQTVTGVTVSGPAGAVTLTNQFGTYFAFNLFNTAAALEAKFPAGNYTMNATGAGAVTLAVGTPAQLPVPQVSNLPALLTMDVTKDYTMNFSAFTGANASTDGIFISIVGDGGGEFHAPDPCVPRTLPVTASSVVIPANTFKAGEKLTGTISFSRGAFNTNSVANTSFSSAVINSTKFEFTAGGGGGTPVKPTWTSIVRNADGTITYTVQADAGTALSFEGSDRPDTGWVQVSTAVVATGTYQLTIDPKLAPKRFFRALVL